MVSVIAFSSKDQSLNPAKSTVFILEMFEKNENNQKEAGDGLIFKKVRKHKQLYP